MSMKNILGLYAAAVAMSGSKSIVDKNNLKPSDIDVSPKDLPIPKGCKRYYFNKNGECNKPESEIYFDCLKPSKAHEKFKKYLNSLS